MNLKACYDPNTDKILNCKKYSFEWFHEDRHRQQYKKNNLAKKIDFFVSMGLFGFGLSILFCIINYPFTLRNLMVVTMLLSFYPACIWILEIDAWIYQVIAYKKHQKELQVKRMIKNFKKAMGR